jgi:OFA family oxalate/formate antiporter-like MFS transporter
MGMLSLANGLGRFLYGTLSDRLGRAPTMFLSALLMGLAILATIPLTKALGFAGLSLAVLVVGSSYGGGIPQTTAMIMQFFGPRHFGVNLGIASSQIAVGGLLGPQMAAFLRTSTGAYGVPLTITGVLALVACLVALGFGRHLRQGAEAAAY